MGQHRLVPQVDAVKGSHGDGASAVFRSQVVQAAD